jgi:YlmC/YmxH family sporulation protein
MKLSELASKDVISSEDGMKLGRINDLDIDIATGKIIHVSVKKGIRLFSNFGGKEDELIRYDNITKIGSDVIMIKQDQHYKKE